MPAARLHWLGLCVQARCTLALHSRLSAQEHASQEVMVMPSSMQHLCCAALDLCLQASPQRRSRTGMNLIEEWDLDAAS